MATVFLAEIARRVRRAAGEGMALHAGPRAVLERGLGADLAAVRIHDDDESDWLAAVIGADAFACGADLFFRSGAYNPGTTVGMVLLAHEVAHAVQQAEARSGMGCSPVHVSRPHDVSEQAADAAAKRVMRGHVADQRAPRMIARRLAAHDPVVIQRYSSWEHRLLGDAPSTDLNEIAQNKPKRQEILEALSDFLLMWHQRPEDVTEKMITDRYPYIRTLELGPDKVLITYGELNTLPDYMVNPAVLDAQPKEILLPILQTIRQQGYNCIQRLLNGKEMPFKYTVAINTEQHLVDFLFRAVALNNLTWRLQTNYFLALVGRNACHFAPYSWYRWKQFHTIAREKATEAHSASDPKQKAELTRQAWIHHGYADHFLQDSFAAGHLINKTLVMQWFVEWAADKSYAHAPDWDMVKTMTTANQPGLAARGLYNPASPGSVRDPQTAEEKQNIKERMDTCGVKKTDSTTQETAYQCYLAFLNSTVAQSACGAFHDYFNAKSLHVSPSSSETPFQIWGDNTMLNSGDNDGYGLTWASETAHLSQEALSDILMNGSTIIAVESISNRFPMYVWVGGKSKKVEEWNDSLKTLAPSLFLHIPYYLLRFVPRIEYISVDQILHPLASAEGNSGSVE